MRGKSLAVRGEVSPLVEVRDLTVEFGERNRPVRAVNSATLSIAPGEIVGIAGESGSGKSTLCSAMIRTSGGHARISGQVMFRGEDLNALSERRMRELRGSDIAMVLQNPMTSLDPLFTVGGQVREVLRERGVRPADRAAAISALRRVHLTAPEVRVGQYPHQLSGGMRQRVLTAMATAASPSLLIADEPTTALDATVQEEILLLFREIRDRFGTAIVIVTHDLHVIRRLCDRVVIMYAGRIMEEGPTEDIFRAPRQPYTQGLIGSLPRVIEGGVVLQPIPGQVPNLAGLGPGCPFSDRCPVVLDRCPGQWPEATWVGPGHRTHCWQTGKAA